MTDTEDYQRVYAEFWRDLVETGGKLDQDKVARELYDYHVLLRDVQMVYDSVTMGRLSKPNTRVDAIVSTVADLQQEACDDVLREAASAIKQHCDVDAHGRVSLDEVLEILDVGQPQSS